MYSIFLTIAIIAIVLCLQSFSMQVPISDPQISCNASSISIAFNKTELDLQNQNYKFHFFNETSESCMVNSSTIEQNNNSLTSSFDQCGMLLHEVGNNSIVYNQTVILYFFNSSIVISGETSYKVQCVKDNNQTASHLNGPIQVTINEDNIVKSSNAKFDVKLLRTNTHYNVTELSGVSKMGDDVFFKLVLETPRNDLVLSPQNCYATNGINSNIKYYLIQDRCPNPRDSSVTIDVPSSASKEFVWHNQSFRFHGTSNELHFACDVLICVASNQDAACKRCGSVGGSGGRKRRSVSSLISDDHHAMHKMTTKATPLKIISTPLL